MTASQDTTGLPDRIAAYHVPRGQVTAWWLGGSGFVFKSPAGAQIYIDPYLSDVVSAIFGISRAFPPPIQAAEARPDLVIATHCHEDHLDPESIPTIAQHSPETRFLMPPTAMSRTVSWGVPRTRIQPFSSGQSVELKDVTITHTPARHESGIAGWEVPDAMGVVLHVDGLQIYHTGDTEYDIRLRLLRRQAFDVVLICINGVGGNMNAYEAAMLAWQLGAGTVIPMHHYLWASASGGDEETLDPALFAATYRKLGGTGRIIIPKLGQPIDLWRETP